MALNIYRPFVRTIDISSARGFSAIAASIAAQIWFAARRVGSLSRCAYLAVVAWLALPKQLANNRKAKASAGAGEAVS